MAHVPVFYATAHGQTMRIAERIAAGLQSAGHASVALEVTSTAARTCDWRRVDGAVVAASLHAGSHQAVAEDFVRSHIRHLNALPCWFVSVSLSAASPNANERQAAERIAHAFPTATGWSARRISCVAGRLAYTRYSMITRWMMRRIARKEGAPTDTSRDYELTDWTALDASTWEFATEVWQCAGVTGGDDQMMGPLHRRADAS
ncbi:MAG TPA: flavodoxin domain-containing protein [Luteitalea sp.]|nr:flavodoxin domain-containing protein [Luteitalea sp.]